MAPVEQSRPAKNEQWDEYGKKCSELHPQQARQREGSPDRPGLLIARRCRYFWDTVPMLARDPQRIEDVVTDGPDHGADVIRYGCLCDELATSVKLVLARWWS